MNILLLPGMDGTGVMFEPFVKSLPNSANVQIAKLIQEKDVSFAEQASALLSNIKKDTVIVGESYSGLIAHEIGKLAPDSVKHIVYAASFLEPPSILAKFGNLMPKTLLNYSLYPETVVKEILFGKYKSKYLMGLFRRAMSDVPLDLLEFRIKQIANLKQLKCNSDIPATYLQAKQDKLVSENAAKVFKKAYSNLKLKRVDGSHFVLQTNPQECSREVLALAAK
ncbi:alpha/beta fold hydrolase [Glaciecola sp. MF2-115]|uniref:alpha/beta fold hydrolase n=1 Tax=Glaciecola sp. MF2-115 TaxID=3384827 RepID=UPI00399F6883